MTGGQITVLCTVIGCFVAVLTIVLTVRDRTAKQARLESAARKQAYQDGRDSRNDEVELIKSQRDDARHERDLAQARGDEFERRYYETFRDRGR